MAVYEPKYRKRINQEGSLTATRFWGLPEAVSATISEVHKSRGKSHALFQQLPLEHKNVPSPNTDQTL